MPRAPVDTTVLFAAACRRDCAHDDALAILRGVDNGNLTEAAVVDYVLAETLNGLTTHAGHDSATDFLDRVEENTRFHVGSLTADGFATVKTLRRQCERFSFVDACTVAYTQTEGPGYLYAFDDDFVAAEDVYRLHRNRPRSTGVTPTEATYTKSCAVDRRTRRVCRHTPCSVRSYGVETAGGVVPETLR